MQRSWSGSRQAAAGPGPAGRSHDGFGCVCRGPVAAGRVSHRRDRPSRSRAARAAPSGLRGLPDRTGRAGWAAGPAAQAGQPGGRGGTRARSHCRGRGRAGAGRGAAEPDTPPHRAATPAATAPAAGGGRPGARGRGRRRLAAAPGRAARDRRRSRPDHPPDDVHRRRHRAHRRPGLHAVLVRPGHRHEVGVPGQLRAALAPAGRPRVRGPRGDRRRRRDRQARRVAAGHLRRASAVYHDRGHRPGPDQGRRGVVKRRPVA